MTEAARAKRTVFSVSDHTGVTAENLARSLMSLFDQVEVEYVTRPFVDTPAKAKALVSEINQVAAEEDRPIIFSTFAKADLQDLLRRSQGLVVGLFEAVTEELEAELGVSHSEVVGHYHGMGDPARYQGRLDAVDYALSTDDGLGIKHYGKADVILMGVSRVGKTPTCLYLSMHYGINAANYPVSPDEHPGTQLPEVLRPFRSRLYALTIDPRRLSAIRDVRRPGSPYSSLQVCREEVSHAAAIFDGAGIPTVDTTTRSVEEITATIMSMAGLTRRLD